jgi:hypothetical protein
MPLNPWAVLATQGCHNGRFWVKMTVRTSARVRVYPADGFLPSADVVKTVSARTRKYVCADVGVRASARARVPTDVGPRGPASARTRLQGGRNF